MSAACKFSQILLLSLHLNTKGLSRQVNGTQESIIHFTGDHSISGGNQIITDRPVPTPGNSGKG